MVASTLPEFIAATEVRLDEIAEAILALGRGPDDADSRSQLARAAQAIKTGATAHGLRDMVFDAQRIELWAVLPSQGMTPAMMAGLYEARTNLRNQLAGIAE